MIEVPVMAIDDVVIIENSSALYDELISHRLGLVPLKTDLDLFVLPELCKCESSLGCVNCRVLLVLDVEAEDKPLTVYSGDLVSDGDIVKPTSINIPILKLGPKQKIKLEAYAKLGQGKTHAKWIPTCASVLTEIDEDKYELTIESVGSLKSKEIFSRTITILEEKLKTFKSEIKELKIK
jgi:DNA-directed RNA polymerase subunit D